MTKSTDKRGRTTWHFDCHIDSSIRNFDIEAGDIITDGIRRFRVVESRGLNMRAAGELKLRRLKDAKRTKAPK
jgi:hypothetical protein